MSDNKFISEGNTFEKVEGLHTRGEWKLGNGGNQYATARKDGYESALVVKKENGQSVCLGFIWGETKEQSKANAELIVKAVNEHEILKATVVHYQKSNKEMYDERQKLLDSNRELLELLKWISKATNNPEIGIRCDKAINKQ